MVGEVDHEISLIIEELKSNLFFHGHPINRDEAARDLKLKVEPAGTDLEKTMWDLYLAYDDELKMNQPFHPAHELEAAQGASPSAGGTQPVTTQAIMLQLQEMAKMGLGVGTLPPQQHVDLAVAMLPHISGSASGGTPSRKARMTLPGAMVESKSKSHTFLTDFTLERATVPTPAGPQEATKQEIIWQRWEESK